MSEDKKEVVFSDIKIYESNSEKQRREWWEQLWLEVEKLDNLNVELKAENEGLWELLKVIDALGSDKTSTKALIRLNTSEALRRRKYKALAEGGE